MNILAIECASEVLSVAVYRGGSLHEQVESGLRRHGDRLLPLIDAVLEQAGIAKLDLDAVAFGAGPGAFTGVRMAAAAAQGIAYGLDLPALPVSTLAALAQEGFSRGAAAPLLPLLDARMGEVYAGFYELDGQGLVQPLQPDRLLRPEEIALPGDDVWCAFGPGLHAYRGVLSRQLGYRMDALERSVYPHAASVARLAARALRAGEGVAAASALPVYLREKVAQTEAERRQAHHTR